MANPATANPGLEPPVSIEPGPETTLDPNAGLPTATLDPMAAPVEGEDLFVSADVVDIPAAELELLGKEITPDAVATITGWTAPQIETSITPEILQTIQAEQIAKIPVAFFEALSADQVEALNGEQIAKLTSDQVEAIAEHLNADQIVSLTNEQVAGIDTAEALTALRQTFSAAIEAGTIPAELKSAATRTVQELLTGDALAAMPADTFATLAPETLNTLTEAQVGRITGEQLAALPNETVAALSFDTLRALTPETIQSLTREQASALSVVKATNLTESQLDALDQVDTGVYEVLQGKYVEALSGPHLSPAVTSEIALWAPEEIQDLVSPEVVGTINPAEFRRLPPSFIAGFSNEQFGAITSAQLAQATPEQLQGLTPDQVAALSPEALRGLTAEQLNVLTREQIRGLTNDQIRTFGATDAGAALITLANGNRPLDAEWARANLTAADAPIANLSVVELQLMTPAAVTAMGDNISKLDVALVRKMTPEQIAAITPEQAGKLTVEQIEALGGNIRHLSNRAIDAIKFETVRGSEYATSLWRYAQAVQGLREEAVGAAREAVTERRASGANLGLANLEGIHITSITDRHPHVMRTVGGVPQPEAVIMRTSSKFSSTLIPDDVARGPGGSEVRQNVPLYRADEVNIPGVDNAAFTAAFNEFGDSYAQWQALTRQIDNETRSFNGQRFNDISQFTETQRGVLQPLLQARLDQGTEVRAKLEVLHGMLRDAGYDPTSESFPQINDPGTRNAFRYIRFTPTVPVAEVTAEVDAETLKEINALPVPPAPDFVPPPGVEPEGVVVPGTDPGATVQAPVVPPAPAPVATTQTVTAARPNIDLNNNNVHLIVIKTPPGATPELTRQFNAYRDRMEALSAHAETIGAGERGIIYGQMEELTNNFVAGYPGASVEFTPTEQLAGAAARTTRVWPTEPLVPE